MEGPPIEAMTTEELVGKQNEELRRFLRNLKELSDLLGKDGILDQAKNKQIENAKLGKTTLLQLFSVVEKAQSFFEEYSIASDAWKTLYDEQYNMFSEAQSNKGQLDYANRRVADLEAKNAILEEKIKEFEAGSPTTVQQQVQQQVQDQQAKLSADQDEVSSLIALLKANKDEFSAAKGSLSTKQQMIDSAQSDKAKAVADAVTAAEAPLQKNIGALEQQVSNLKTQAQNDQAAAVAAVQANAENEKTKAIAGAEAPLLEKIGRLEQQVSDLQKKIEENKQQCDKDKQQRYNDGKRDGAEEGRKSEEAQAALKNVVSGLATASELSQLRTTVNGLATAKSIEELPQSVANLATVDDMKELREHVGRLATADSIQQLPQSVGHLATADAMEELRRALDNTATADNLNNVTEKVDKIEKGTESLAPSITKLETSVEGLATSGSVSDVKKSLDSIVQQIGSLPGGDSVSQLNTRIDTLATRDAIDNLRNSLTSELAGKIPIDDLIKQVKSLPTNETVVGLASAESLEALKELLSQVQTHQTGLAAASSLQDHIDYTKRTAEQALTRHNNLDQRINDLATATAVANLTGTINNLPTNETVSGLASNGELAALNKRVTDLFKAGNKLITEEIPKLVTSEELSSATASIRDDILDKNAIATKQDIDDLRGNDRLNLIDIHDQVGNVLAALPNKATVATRQDVSNLRGSSHVDLTSIQKAVDSTLRLASLIPSDKAMKKYFEENVVYNVEAVEDLMSELQIVDKLNALKKSLSELADYCKYQLLTQQYYRDNQEHFGFDGKIGNLEQQLTSVLQNLSETHKQVKRIPILADIARMLGNLVKIDLPKMLEETIDMNELRDDVRGMSTEIDNALENGIEQMRVIANLPAAELEKHTRLIKQHVTDRSQYIIGNIEQELAARLGTVRSLLHKIPGLAPAQAEEHLDNMLMLYRDAGNTEGMEKVRAVQEVIRSYMGRSTRVERPATELNAHLHSLRNLALRSDNWQTSYNNMTNAIIDYSWAPPAGVISHPASTARHGIKNVHVTGKHGRGETPGSGRGGQARKKQQQRTLETPTPMAGQNNGDADEEIQDMYGDHAPPGGLPRGPPPGGAGGASGSSGLPSGGAAGAGDQGDPFTRPQEHSADNSGREGAGQGQSQVDADHQLAQQLEQMTQDAAKILDNRVKLRKAIDQADLHLRQVVGDGDVSPTQAAIDVNTSQVSAGIKKYMSSHMPNTLNMLEKNLSTLRDELRELSGTHEHHCGYTKDVGFAHLISKEAGLNVSGSEARDHQKSIEESLSKKTKTAQEAIKKLEGLLRTVSAQATIFKDTHGALGSLADGEPRGKAEKETRKQQVDEAMGEFDPARKKVTDDPGVGAAVAFELDRGQEVTNSIEQYIEEIVSLEAKARHATGTISKAVGKLQKFLEKSDGSTISKASTRSRGRGGLLGFFSSTEVNKTGSEDAENDVAQGGSQGPAEPAARAPPQATADTTEPNEPQAATHRDPKEDVVLIPPPEDKKSKFDHSKEFAAWAKALTSVDGLALFKLPEHWDDDRKHAFYKDVKSKLLTQRRVWADVLLQLDRVAILNHEEQDGQRNCPIAIVQEKQRKDEQFDSRDKCKYHFNQDGDCYWLKFVEGVEVPPGVAAAGAFHQGRMTGADGHRYQVFVRGHDHFEAEQEAEGWEDEEDQLIRGEKPSEGEGEEVQEE